jgi:MscS family membrane protein
MLLGSVFSNSYLGSTLPQYVAFFTVVGAGAVLGRALSYLYRRRLRQKVEKTEIEIDDIIVHALGGPVVLLGVIAGIAVGRRFLTPVGPLRSVLSVGVDIPIIVALAWIAVRLTDGLIGTYVEEYAARTESKLDDELVPIVSRVTNIAVVSIAGVVIMDTVGYDVTAIVASLGVGGIAVAFASRKTMADIFGGAHILATKPFLVGDVVDIDGTAGTVEEVGLRTTRLRSFDGRSVTLPNAAIADAEITNITSESSRRIKTFIGLPYDTTPDEMASALDLIESAANGVEGVDPERTGAWFWEYGETAMKIRLEYYIDETAQWKEVRNAVNRDIQRAFDDAGIDLIASRRLRTRAADARGAVPPDGSE